MNAELTDPNDAVPEMPESASPRQERILKLSRVFRLVSRILMLAVVLVAISVVAPLIQRGMNGDTEGMTPQMAFFPVTLVVHAYWFCIVWLLERMFNAFVKHGVFHPAGARILKWLGSVFIVAGLIQISMMILEMIQNSIHPSMFVGLFGTVILFLLGSFILMFGWVLEEACELREQQEYTI